MENVAQNKNTAHISTSICKYLAMFDCLIFGITLEIKKSLGLKVATAFMTCR